MTKLDEIIHKSNTARTDNRTAAEQQVADWLDRYNFGYLQNQPLAFYDGKSHHIRTPAFWLPQNNNVIIDVTAEPESAHHLRQLYDNNGFDNIVLIPQDMTCSSWPYDLYQQLTSYPLKQPYSYLAQAHEYK